MATILRSYDWSKVSHNNRRARSRSYPWDDWFDGRIHELHPKEDFDGPATSLERVIRTSANRRNIKVRIRIDSGNVVMQQHDGDEPLRTVTKSPSAKSIKEKRLAAAAAETNGGHETAPKGAPSKVTHQAQSRTLPHSAPMVRRRLVRTPAS